VVDDDAALRRPSSDGRRPLTRKPKQLDAKPELADVTTATKTVIAPTHKGSEKTATAAHGHSAPGPTGEDGSVVRLPHSPAAIPAEIAREALAIAARLAIAPPLGARRTARGGLLVDGPFDGAPDDINIDRTLERLLRPGGNPRDSFVVHQRRSIRRALILLVDTSGSMRGERTLIAAAAVGALVSTLRHDEVAVIAFAAGATVVQQLGPPEDAGTVVSNLLRVEAEGLTNLAFPLEIAADMLRTRPRHEQRVVLLSDCVHNAGPDPRPSAARLERVDVLLDVTEEHDRALGRELAREGRGRVCVIRRRSDVAVALNTVFAH
jgi:Mg-chelatase subunit ChlD